MTLKGIDVSSHDNYNGNVFKANTESAYQDSDFVIVKATQGRSYTYTAYTAVANRVLADGKLLGFYHYAGGNDAGMEAERFYNAIKDYIGKAIPCLDWESYQNNAWGNTAWCRQFVDRFHELSGVWCLIYVQASARNQAASCATDCGLWLAGYPDNRNSFDVPNCNYKTEPWEGFTIWQFTSSNGATDRNVARLTAETWAKIAAGDGTVTPEPMPTPEEDHTNKGSTAIAGVQAWAGSAADGIYGPNTKKALIKKLQSELNSQFGAGLSVDGIWGPKTKAACVNVKRGAKGNLTKTLQGFLICNGLSTNGFDGNFGAGTESAVKEYQRQHGLTVDGIAGKATFAKLCS